MTECPCTLAIQTGIQLFCLNCGKEIEVDAETIIELLPERK